MKIEELRKYISRMRSIEHKVVADQLFFIKKNKEYLVIGRDYFGISCVKNVKGNWSKEEMESACIVFYETEASTFEL